MVSLETIRRDSGFDELDLQTVFHYLQARAEPVATTSNPLPVIAPAVYKLHRRANSLLLSLGKRRPARTQATSAGTAFSEITDCYVVLTGIAPPTGPDDRRDFEAEVGYARDLVDFSYRLLREAGGRSEVLWQPVQLSEEARLKFSEEMQSIKKGRFLPGFAQQDRMKRGSNYASWVSWIFIIFWILWMTGFIPVIFAFLGLDCDGG